MSELKELQSILDANKHMNFVQRILEPQKFPRYNNADGSYSTHLMSDAEVDGKHIVYPSLIHYPHEKQLRLLGPDQALHHAMNTGEYVEFPTAEKASWFSQNYKKVWEKE